MAITLKASSDGRINILFGYDENRINQIKKVEGYKWNTNQKVWSIPCNEKGIKALVLAFHDEVFILHPSIMKLESGAVIRSQLKENLMNQNNYMNSLKNELILKR